MEDGGVVNLGGRALPAAEVSKVQLLSQGKRWLHGPAITSAGKVYSKTYL